jgi:hypothetical protein
VGEVLLETLIMPNPGRGSPPDIVFSHLHNGGVMRLSWALFLSIGLSACGDKSDRDADGDGWTTAQGDCNDSDPNISPTVNDLAGDGVDQNCDGADGVDSDGDGWASLLSGGGDCDDARPEIHPDAGEVCDGADNNCDGVVDGDDAEDLTTWWLDADRDGFGTSSEAVRACDSPGGGYVVAADPEDCDDGDASINPGAEEVCNDGIDDDCDGAADDDDDSVAPGSLDTFFADSDGDRYGDNDAPLEACAPPEDYVTDNTDCDDSDASINPGAEEVCNGGIDDDCDGAADDDDISVAHSSYDTFYQDLDSDGYGDQDRDTESCAAPPGYVEGGIGQLDCDDGDPDVNPAAVEVCNDIDDDCDDQTDDDDPDVDTSSYLTWYFDSDGDGYGTPDTVAEACAPPVRYVDPGEEDCDDRDAAINPGADEVCNGGVDDDCDGVADDDDASTLPSSLDTFYADADEDGYGDEADTLQSCVAPEGYIAAGGEGLDCDDGDPDINPAAHEVLGDGLDNDCDLEIDLLLASADATAWLGGDADINLGEDLAVPGDLNGDGFADLLIGGEGTDLSDSRYAAGQLLIFYGPITSDGLHPLGSADADATVSGLTAGDRVGSSLSALGDVDGDGAPDFAVAAYGTNSYDGEAYLFFDAPAGELDRTDASVTVTSSGGIRLGEVSYVGDLNDDNYNDFVISAGRYDSRAGAAFLFYGPLTADTSIDDADVIIAGEAAGDYLADVPQPAPGDVDGDGIDDLLIASYAANSESGEAYLYYGPISADGPGDADLTVTGDAGDKIGIGLALSDFSGDGYADILLSGAYSSQLLSGDGVIYIVEGGASGGDLTVADAAASLTGAEEYSYCGEALEPIGDPDGDGYHGFLASTRDDIRTGYEGALYLVSGPLSGAAVISAVASDQVRADAYESAGLLSTTWPADLDGDDATDLVFGSFYSSEDASYEGSVHLLSGALP